MFIHYRSRCFVLKKEDRGESDQLFTVYTKNFGKLEILGRAIRKISSKLRAGINLFYLSDIEFIQGRVYKTLTDAMVIEKFENIRKDLKRLKIAYKISEVFNELIKEQEKDENIWNILIETIQLVNTPEVKNEKLEIVYYYFFWNLISFLGYKPELYKCVICHKSLDSKNFYFNHKEGGIICANCFKKERGDKKISQETIKIIRLFLKRDWSTLKKIKINSENLKLLNLKYA